MSKNGGFTIQGNGSGREQVGVRSVIYLLEPSSDGAPCDEVMPDPGRSPASLTLPESSTADNEVIRIADIEFKPSE